MSSEKTVTIIGGGISGLASAVFLTEKNFKVNLIEASPKLGGRAYSFFDSEKNQFFDNGQHILAGWYKNTFEYLKIIGSYDKLNFQKALEVNYLDADKKIYKLKCPDIKPPLNMAAGVLRFDAFTLKDKWALKNIYKLFRKEESLRSEYRNVSELLKGIDQTENLIKYFWEPFSLAVFNTKLQNIDTGIFLNILKTGFKDAGNANLVIPDVNLNELFIKGVLEYFVEKNIKFVLNTAGKNFVIHNSLKKINYLMLESGDKLSSDYYISAVPFYSFKKLFDPDEYERNKYKADQLRTSSIVSVHLFFENEIPEKMIPGNSYGMTGLIGTNVQWIFKRNERFISLVISGADELGITEMTKEEIFKLSIYDLNKNIVNFNEMIISDYKVIKEKRATFIPDFKSTGCRPDQKTGYDNLFIAGDWTNTGLPATIESAVTSAKICTELISNKNNNNN